jgi:hypothetical protein
MVTVRRNEANSYACARQARLVLAFAALLSGLWPYSASPARAQDLPFTHTTIDWKLDALERQRRSYRAGAFRNELLFCIEVWRTREPSNGFQLVTIERTRKEAVGERHGINGTAAKCRDAQGRPLPTIHTHSEGNCQPSPTDLIMIAARGAPFDGIQCGEHHVVWIFSWQIKTIANAVHDEAVTRPRNPDRGPMPSETPTLSSSRVPHRRCGTVRTLPPLLSAKR